ncbi:MAG: ABC transporter ATP-binding protein [Deltaproteobacteria bacterium]|nr:ABC transporter ATP-binding protein [Deltaproteobacteria bacterium]
MDALVPLIEVRNLTKHFETGHGRVEVLSGIDLVIRHRERIAVMGASGAGKTTFMNILGGLDHPSGGSVLIEGRDISRFGGGELDRFRNSTIGFVFQFHQLLPEFSALENVMMPALIAGDPYRKAREKALYLLERVGLSHRLVHKPGELSGGEQQRVAVARALAMKPRILLADEPTGNLDSRTSEEILELLNSLHAGGDFTMLIVTHDESLARRQDRLIVMKDGRVER